MGGGERSLRPAVGYSIAALAATTAIGAAARGLLGVEEPSAPAVFAAAGSSVVVVLAVTAGRLGLRPPLRVFAAAPVLGFLLAAAAHLAVILPLSLFYSPATDLLDVLIGAPDYADLDARLLVVLLVTAAVVAPLTEEPAKAVSAGFSGAVSARGAFVAGATAGAGFSIVEHAFFALPAADYPDVWVQVLLLRSVSAAMHPLATGLVFLGWWEFRRSGSRTPLVRGLALGVGLHAAWNATAIVMEGISVVASEGEAPGVLETVALGYAALVGIAIAAVMWHTITVVAADDPLVPSAAPLLGGRVWAILAVALSVPLLLLVVVLPRLA